MNEIIYYFLLFIIYSFMGWLYESILISTRERQLVNRGFLNGPLCPVYGSGAVIVVYFLGSLDNPFIVFPLGIILTAVLEYFTSYFMEVIFHAKWWDYSERRFNLNGRICLLGAFVFGCMSLLVVFILNPHITDLLYMIDYTVLHVCTLVVLTVLAIDFYFTINSLLDLNARLADIQTALDTYYENSKLKGTHLIEESKMRSSKIIEESLEKGSKLFNNSKEKGSKFIEESKLKKDKIKESLFVMFEESEYYSDKVKNMLNLKKFQDRRIIMAFPHIKSTKYHDALEKFKETIKKNPK